MGKLEDFMARGTVSASDGSKPMREVQINLLAGEVRDEVEHAEPYGFTSEPLTDGLPEAFALFFDGDRSHGVVFCIADRRYRLKPLSPGEVAIYDDLGQKVHLTRNGIEVVTPKDLTATVTGSATIKAASVTIDSPTTHITGSLLVDGAMTGKGGITVSGGSGATVTGDVVADGISLKSHTHPGDSGGTTGTPQ